MDDALGDAALGDLGEVEAGAEVIALAAERRRRASRSGRLTKVGVELRDQRIADGVALVRPVQADVQDRARAPRCAAGRATAGRREGKRSRAARSRSSDSIVRRTLAASPRDFPSPLRQRGAAFGYLPGLMVNVENYIGTRWAWQAPFCEHALYTFRDAHSDPSDRTRALPGGLDHGKMRGLLGYNLAQAAIPSLKIFNKRIGEPFQLRRIDFTILMLVASNPERHPAPDVAGARRLGAAPDARLRQARGARPDHAHAQRGRPPQADDRPDAQGRGAGEEGRAHRRRHGERAARPPQRERARRSCSSCSRRSRAIGAPSGAAAVARPVRLADPRCTHGEPQ